MMCEHCKSWRRKPGDRYCGRCGQALFDRIPVWVKQPVTEPVRRSVTVVNQSDFRSVLELEAPPWLKMDATKLELEPNVRRDVGFTVLLENIGGVLMKSDYVAVRQAGTIVHETRIDLFPAPKEVSAKEVSVYDCTHEARLHLKSSPSPFRVGRLEFKPREPFVELAATGLPLDLGVRWTPTPVAIRATGTGTTEVDYEIADSDGGFRLQGSFKLTIKKPPTLGLEGDNTRTGRPRIGKDVTPDEKGGRFVLDVTNNGDDELELRDVSVSCHTEAVIWQQGFKLVMTDPGQQDVKPVKIPRGQRRTIELHYDTKPTARGDLEAEARFDTNDPANPVVELVLRIREGIHQGVLAIDYGTSTSSAAICARTAESVPLEEGASRITSDVFFFKFDPDAEPKYDYAIGKEAERVQDPTRLASGAKVLIGTPHKMEVLLRENRHLLKPEEVVEWAVMELVRFARQGLGALPTRLVFTEPTRFTLRQRRIMEAALSKAALSKGITVVPKFRDEAFAAGFYFVCEGIARDTELRCRDHYDLLVLDMGGGTTDVTLFRVEQDPASEGKLPKPRRLEVLGAWGDQTLGGKALSRTLEEKIREKHGEPLPGAAEYLKLAVSEYLKLQHDQGQVGSSRPAVEPDRALLARSVVRCDPGNSAFVNFGGASHIRPEDADMILESVQKAGSIGVDLSHSSKSSARIKVEDVAEWLQPRLDRFAEEMEYFLQRVGDVRPDMLLLGGQASLLPLVPQTFARFAERCDYVRGPDQKPRLKESVAMGAALYITYGATIPIVGLDRFWHELGVPGSGSFNVLVPWHAVPGKHRAKITFGGDSCVQRDYRRPKPFITFDLQENMTLGPTAKPEPYQSYEVELDSYEGGDYEGEVVLNADGVAEVFCRIDDKLVPMNPVNGREA